MQCHGVISCVKRVNNMKNNAIWLCLLMSSTVFAAPEPPATPWPGVELTEASLFSNAGYRIKRFRSPTPPTHEQATVIETQTLLRMLAKQPDLPLIDVRPADITNGIFIYSAPHLSLPDSVWLPNVGKGVLDNDTTDYYRKHLTRLTEGDKNNPVVLFCRADCWMSWNAAKRAANWGYTQLYWYRDGIDGWEEADKTLVSVTPTLLGQE